MTARRPRNEPTAGLDTNARLGMTNVRRILRHKSRGLYGNLIADPAVGFDDIIQEGLLAAWDARLTWNPAAGRTLVDWMAAKGYYQMLETVRRSKVHAHRHPALTRVQDLAVDDCGLDDIDDAAEIVTITGEVRAATRRLTDRHVALLQGHFDGVTQAALADEHGVCNQLVSRVQRRALERIQERVRPVLLAG